MVKEGRSHFLKENTLALSLYYHRITNCFYVILSLFGTAVQHLMTRKGKKVARKRRKRTRKPRNLRKRRKGKLKDQIQTQNQERKMSG